MTTEMFYKLNALVLFLFPEFQMTINTGGYDKVRPEKFNVYKLLRLSYTNLAQS